MTYYVPLCHLCTVYFVPCNVLLCASPFSTQLRWMLQGRYSAQGTPLPEQAFTARVWSQAADYFERSPPKSTGRSICVCECVSVCRFVRVCPVCGASARVSWKYCETTLSHKLMDAYEHEREREERGAKETSQKLASK